MQTYESFWAELSRAYPVSKGGMRVPIVAALQTIDAFESTKMLADLQVLLETILARAGSSDAARQRAIAAGETAIVPYINDTYSGIVRFDCVLDEEGQVKVLELNADYPDGILLHDRTYSQLSGTNSRVHEAALLSYFPPATNIHISHAREAVFLDAYYLEKEVLEAAGHTVTIGDVPDKDPQWHRRCIEASKVVSDDMAWCEESSPHHLNSFALRTLGYKDLLAGIDHPYVPRTYVLNESSLPEISAHPARFVLKPANGCEGRGIYFGQDYSIEEWFKLLASLPSGYIAQEYVSLPKRTVPIYEAGGVVEKELYFDFCPHFFIHEGKVIGSGHILMRFSASLVVNVTQGGAIGYHTLPE
jgi:hypothetical protein